MSIDGILMMDILNEKLLLVRKNMSNTATITSYSDVQFQQQPVILNISGGLTPFSFFQYHNQLNQQKESSKESAFIHNFQQQRNYPSSKANSSSSMLGNPNFHQNATHLYWGRHIFSFLTSQNHYKEQKIEVFRRLSNMLVTKKSAPEKSEAQSSSSNNPPTKDKELSYITLKKTAEAATKLTNLDSAKVVVPGASSNLASTSSTSGISVVGTDQQKGGALGSNEPIDFDTLVINALANELSDFHVYDFQNGRIIMTTEVNGILYVIVAEKEQANEFSGLNFFYIFQFFLEFF